MVAIIVAVVVASGPLIMATMAESPVEVHVWCPQNTGTAPMPPDWYYFQPPSTRLQQFVFSAPDGSNVLRREYIQSVFDFTRSLQDFSIKSQDGDISLQTLCKRNLTLDEGCFIVSVLGIWASHADFLNDPHPAHTVARHKRFDMNNITIDPAAVLLDANLRGDALNASGLVVTIALIPNPSDTQRYYEQLFFMKLRHNLFNTSTHVPIRPDGIGHHRNSHTDNGELFAHYFADPRKVAEKAYLGIAYVLVFAYIYLVVGKFEYVKSKVGLGISAVAIVIGSMSSSIGICIQLGLATHVMAVEVLPFFVMAIGLENMRVITKSVVSTSPFHPVRFRVAQGLARAAVPLLQSLLTMEGALFLGITSSITALQEFCVVACVGILADFILQVVFYVAVLSVDIRRVELSDLAHTPHYSNNTTALLAKEMEEDPLHLSLAPTISLRTSVLLNNAFLGFSMIATVVLAFWDNGSPQASAMIIKQAPGCHGALGSTVVADWRGPLLTSDLHLPAYMSFLPVFAHTLHPLVEIDSSKLSNDPGISEVIITSAWYYIQIVFGLVTVGGSIFLLTIKVVGKTKLFLSGERETEEALAALSLSHLDVCTLRGHRQEIECVASFVDRSDWIATACLGGQIRIWDTLKGRCLDVVRCGYDELGNTRAPAPWCLAAADCFVAVGLGCGDIEVYDLDAGQCFLLRGLPDNPERPVEEHGGIACLAFAGGSLYSASGSGVLERWEWTEDLDNSSHGEDPDCSGDNHSDTGVRIHRSSAFLFTASFSGSARLLPHTPQQRDTRIPQRRLSSVSPLLPLGLCGPMTGSPSINSVNMAATRALMKCDRGTSASSTTSTPPILAVTGSGGGVVGGGVVGGGGGVKSISASNFNLQSSPSITTTTTTNNNNNNTSIIPPKSNISGITSIAGIAPLPLRIPRVREASTSSSSAHTPATLVVDGSDDSAANTPIGTPSRDDTKNLLLTPKAESNAAGGGGVSGAIGAGAKSVATTTINNNSSNNNNSQQQPQRTMQPIIPSSFDFNAMFSNSNSNNNNGGGGGLTITTPPSRRGGPDITRDPRNAHRRVRSEGGRIEISTSHHTNSGDGVVESTAAAPFVNQLTRHARTNSFDSVSSAQSILAHPELGSLRPHRRFACTTTLAGHRTAITSLCPVKNYLLTSSTDRTLKLFDLSLNCLLTMYGHEGSVTCFDIYPHPSPDTTSTTPKSSSTTSTTATTTTTASTNNHAHTASTTTTTTTPSLFNAMGAMGTRLSSSSTTSALQTQLDKDLGATICASGGSDNCVRLWLLRRGTCMRVLKGHQDSILCVKMNSTYVVSSSEDDTIRVWLSDTGRCVRVMDMKQAIVEIALHSSSILLTPVDGAIVAWDLVAGGERVRTIPLSQDDTLPISLSGTKPGLSSTTHLLLNGTRLICDHGTAMKTVVLPLPETRKKTV